MTTTKLTQIGWDETTGILSIKLAGGKGNVLGMAMMDEIQAALREHAAQPTLRMVLLEGGDQHFSFGAAIDEHTKDRIGAMLPAFHTLIRDVASYPVPVVAFVRGRCLGGAFELVLACHFVFATADAQFACPEIKLGVFPPVLAAIGPARLPEPVVNRLLLTGSEMGAAEAHRVGFVSAILGGEKDARDELLAWYHSTLGAYSASSLRHAVRALRVAGGLSERLGNGLNAAERLYLDELCATYDGFEGITAFMQRRKPSWRHA